PTSLVTLVLPPGAAAQPVAPTSRSTATAVATSTAPPEPTVPRTCVEATPTPGADVAFVAAGHAWAVDPRQPATVTCLFAVDDAGFFSWGPLGDRVVLSGLEVRGVG